MNKKLLNTQIEALNKKHGAEIIQFYKEHGFDIIHHNRDKTMNFIHLDYDCKLYCNWNSNENARTITLEQAKELVSTKDFGKMDLDEWLIETEKLGLSEERLALHITTGNTTDWWYVFQKLEGHSPQDKAKILYNKWNTKTDLYTEITAYKLQDGSIVETKELAEIKAKEIKIHKELKEFHNLPFADFVIENLETIKQIINQ